MCEFADHSWQQEKESSMLQTQSLVISAKLESGEIPSILLRLSADGWKPALLESQRAFLTLAGVADKVQLPIPQPRTSSRRESEAIAGDVFFVGEDVYYITTDLPGQTVSVLDRLGRRILYRASDITEPAVEIGVISPDATGLGDRLTAFAAAVEQAIKSCVDGRRTRHFNFNWRERDPGTPRLSRIASADEAQSGPSFSRATLVQE
jgi:hypothetical protein